MESDVPSKFCSVYFVIIVAVFLPVSVAENSAQQFESFTQLACTGSRVCLESKPSKSLNVASIGQCALECRRHKQQPEVCVGANYRQCGIICEIFFSDQNIRNTKSFTRNVAGCQYIQRNAVQNLTCFEIFPSCVVKATSLGYATPSNGGVSLNNVTVFTTDPSSTYRGFNIIEVSNCSVSGYYHFDTNSGAAEANSLANYINGLPISTVLVGVTADDAQWSLTTAAKNSLHTIGVNVTGLQYRDKISFIAQVGRPSVALMKMAPNPPYNLLTLWASISYSPTTKDVEITLIN